MTAQDIIIRVLKEIYDEQGFTKEEELADYLGTSTVSVWRWRNGYLDKSTRILVPLLWTRYAAAEVI
jgi:hypothetical protein